MKTYRMLWVHYVWKHETKSVLELFENYYCYSYSNLEENLWVKFPNSPNKYTIKSVCTIESVWI